MAITIEPGIYLKAVGGARVEDVLLITDDGCESLTLSIKELLISTYKDFESAIDMSKM